MSAKPTFDCPDRKFVTGTMATSASSVGTGVAGVEGAGVGDPLVSVSDGEGDSEEVDSLGPDVALPTAASVGLGEDVRDAPDPPLSAAVPTATTRMNAPPRIAGPANRRFDFGR